MAPRVETFSEIKCRVGESPVWDAEGNSLLWCDIPAGRIHSASLDGQRQDVWTLPEPVGSFGLADDGRLVVALASGVALFDRESGKLDRLVEIEREHATERPHRRLNDGKVGPDGAFWVGSMHKDAPGGAALWRVTGDGRAERKLGGLHIANGIAFSGDGRSFYLSDTGPGWIDRWDMDPATGAISGRSRFSRPSSKVGRPDGGATDVEGHYWCADAAGGRLVRLDPEGQCVEVVDVPPRYPTMPCFGGEDMRAIFLTSLRRPDDCSSDCGKVFRLRVEVQGVAVKRFATNAP